MTRGNEIALLRLSLNRTKGLNSSNICTVQNKNILWKSLPFRLIKYQGTERVLTL